MAARVGSEGLSKSTLYRRKIAIILELTDIAEINLAKTLHRFPQVESYQAFWPLSNVHRMMLPCLHRAYELTTLVPTS